MAKACADLLQRKFIHAITIRSETRAQLNKKVTYVAKNAIPRQNSGDKTRRASMPLSDALQPSR
jgi:hypothetical protein